MSIKFNGYYASKGTTSVSHFWGDVHTETFRADAIINTFADLKSQVEKYEADETAFDRTDFSSHSKFIKANREYDTMLERTIDIRVLVFKYQGKEYRTETRKLTVAWKIQKMADEVISDKTERTICLVSDATDEIIAKNEITYVFDNKELEELIG